MHDFVLVDQVVSQSDEGGLIVCSDDVVDSLTDEWWTNQPKHSFEAFLVHASRLVLVLLKVVDQLVQRLHIEP